MHKHVFYHSGSMNCQQNHYESIKQFQVIKNRHAYEALMIIQLKIISLPYFEEPQLTLYSIVYDFSCFGSIYSNRLLQLIHFFELFPRSAKRQCKIIFNPIRSPQLEGLKSFDAAVERNPFDLSDFNAKKRSYNGFYKNSCLNNKMIDFLLEPSFVGRTHKLITLIFYQNCHFLYFLQIDQFQGSNKNVTQLLANILYALKWHYQTQKHVKHDNRLINSVVFEQTVKF